MKPRLTGFSAPMKLRWSSARSRGRSGDGLAAKYQDHHAGRHGTGGVFPETVRAATDFHGPRCGCESLTQRTDRRPTTRLETIETRNSHRLRLGLSRIQARHSAEDRRRYAAAFERLGRPFRWRRSSARHHRRLAGRGRRSRYRFSLFSLRPALERRRLRAFPGGGSQARAARPAMQWSMWIRP